jgi:uncharacterized protein YbjT (DUF2867 family)
MKEKILITAATGKTGAEATKQLLKEGYPVRIFVRSRNAKALELEKLGAEIAIGQFSSYEQWFEALKGIDRVYYCYPIMKGMPESVSKFIKAAEAQNIESVVFMGQWLAEFPDQKSLLTNDTKKCYGLLSKSTLNVVYYNPGFFAENIISLTEIIVQLGIMPNPFGDGICPWISAADQGRVIAALLRDPKPYYGKKVHPTGPKSISMKEMAAIYSRILGRKIMLMPVSDTMFMKAILAARKEYGYDAFTAVQTVFYAQEYKLNRFAVGGPTDVVKQLTGHEPENFQTIARHFIDTSAYSQRTFTNRIEAMKEFMKILFIKLPSKAEQEALNR